LLFFFEKALTNISKAFIEKIFVKKVASLEVKVSIDLINVAIAD
jgi:hypothetical protein